MDLRWVGTRVVQPMSYRTTPTVNPTVLPVSVDGSRGDIAFCPQLRRPPRLGLPRLERSVAPIDAAPASTSQSTAYGTVLGMLRGWEKTDHATR